MPMPWQPPTPEEVDEWAAKIDRLGFVKCPVEDVQYGSSDCIADPDNIPMEFYCPNQGWLLTAQHEVVYIRPQLLA